MKAPDAYLADVLNGSPRTRLEHLFRLRKNRKTTAEPAPEAAAPGFMRTEEVEAVLRRVEAALFTARVEENEAALMAIAGKTDIHTRWWKRLHIANESRPALERLAARKSQWRAILARIQEIVAAPQATRDEARNRFLAEVTPILSRSDRPKINLYALLQTYGDRTVFETLMSRLLIDAPAFHALESFFFANFNPDAGGGLVGLPGETRTPRSRYCPVKPEAAPPAPPAWIWPAMGVVYLGAALFWIRLFFTP